MRKEIKQQNQQTILKLENSVNSQAELDNLWGEIKGILICEMSSFPDLPISNLWNENLDLAWKDVSNAEKNYLLYKANCN